MRDILWMRFEIKHEEHSARIFFSSCQQKLEYIVDADPFDLILKSEHETCELKYIGPSTAIISTTGDCISPIQKEN